MEKTFMRVDKELLKKLRARKQVARESYADVVKRMIDQEVKPDYSHEAVMKKLLKNKKNKMKGRAGQSLMPSGF